MPLAFTQEDFLVFIFILLRSSLAVDFGCHISSCHGKRLCEGSEACFSKLRLPASKAGLN